MTRHRRPGCPDAEAVLELLKGFQRAAVEVGFERLYTAKDSSKRFLIADEVGLGKTLIARGIVAKAIDHLWDDVDRIDVVYICSNLSIARQNIRRLSFGELTPVDRLTMLPVTASTLGGTRKNPQRLNYFAFTPGTSFVHASRLGTARERQLLYYMMEAVWPIDGKGAINLLQRPVRTPSRWRASLRRFREENKISKDLQNAFGRRLKLEDEREREQGGDGICARWQEACHEFRRYRERTPKPLKRIRSQLVSELRRLLAQSCVGALEPDLVILDEFQRFKQLLVTEDPSPAAELAQELFGWQDDKTGDAARVLLLSATPYKMYTLAHECEEDDHYEDFLRTVEFLQRDPSRTDALRQDLSAFRRETYRIGQGGEKALPAIRTSIETSLRRVISRTERTLPGQGSDGMLRTVPMPGMELHTAELEDYLGVQRVARAVESPDLIELWKSSPYLLSLADDYAFKRDVEDGISEARPDSELVPALDRALSCRLRVEDVEAYERIDPRNARLRSLEADVVETGLWKCLWIPPSMPSYELGEPFASAAQAGATKRLVFSAWAIVPKAIASLLSYEVERRAITGAEGDPGNTAEDRKRRTPLLNLTRSEGRLTGMPVLALMYPSPALAWLADPREIAARGGQRQTLAGVLAAAEEAIAESLKPLLANAPDSGTEDESWYWAAPILLDLRSRSTGRSCRHWWEDAELATTWSQGGDAQDEASQLASKGWSEHVDEAWTVVTGEHERGRPPDDLARVLAELALAGPANAALRALHRVCPGSQRHGLPIRTAAARIGWGFRSFFNGIEATAIVRERDRSSPYWRKLLGYCSDGGLGDLLDEHLHVSRDQLGLFEAKAGDASQRLADALLPVLGLRASRQEYHSFEFRRRKGRATGVSIERQRLRGHFAMRFGTEKAESDDQAGQRADDVRAAFNSPFWPLVLATTSVGQEGLDFHLWCHAVVHWNLPANPVDLEQREGRVHRFKGHAVRKNVAADHCDSVLDLEPSVDPWQAIFENARAAALDDRSGLIPFWIYDRPGGSFIERRVPCLPLSRDALRLDALRRSLAVYRMVFGQPRQDDLLAFLLQSVDAHEIENLSRELRVDLSPRPSVV